MNGTASNSIREMFNQVYWACVCFLAEAIKKMYQILHVCENSAVSAGSQMAPKLFSFSVSYAVREANSPFLLLCFIFVLFCHSSALTPQPDLAVLHNLSRPCMQSCHTCLLVETCVLWCVCVRRCSTPRCYFCNTQTGNWKDLCVCDSMNVPAFVKGIPPPTLKELVLIVFYYLGVV